MPVQSNQIATVAADDLNVVCRTKVWFGHQSVGMSVLAGVDGVFAAHGIPAPPIEQGQAETEPGPQGGFIAHEFIGENERPLLKIQAFDRAMRGGVADRVDVALMKFCYIDFTSGTDVDALFARYTATMTALQTDYPDVAFVHATVPLTTESGWMHKLKSKLRSSDRFSPAESAVRERFNALMVNECGDNNLFDLAAAESTQPDGTKVVRRYNGQEYAALCNGYAADLGHLNQQGAEIVAAALLRAIAQASGK